MPRPVLIWMACLLVAGSAFAEKIVIKKSGKVIEGNIVERNGDYVKVVHTGGVGWYLLDDLESESRDQSNPLAGLARPDPRAIGYATITAPEVVIQPPVDNYGQATGLQVFDLVDETADGYVVWMKNADGKSVLVSIPHRDRLGNENGEIFRGKLRVRPQRTPRLRALPIVLKRGEEYPVTAMDDASYELIYRKGSFETHKRLRRDQASYNFLSRELRFAREQRKLGRVYFDGQWVTREERDRLLEERRNNPKPVSQLEKMKSERRLELARVDKERQRSLEETQIRNLNQLQEGKTIGSLRLETVARPPRPPLQITRLQLRGVTPGAGEEIRVVPVVHLQTSVGGSDGLQKLTLRFARINLESGARNQFPDREVQVPATGQSTTVEFEPLGMASAAQVETTGHVIELWNGRSLVDFLGTPDAVAAIANISPPGAPPAPPEPEPEEGPEPGHPGPEFPMPGGPPAMGPPPASGLHLMTNPGSRGGGDAGQEEGIITGEVQKILAGSNVRSAPIDVRVRPDAVSITVGEIPSRISSGQLNAMAQQIIERASQIQTDPGTSRKIDVNLRKDNGEWIQTSSQQ